MGWLHLLSRKNSSNGGEAGHASNASSSESLVDPGNADAALSAAVSALLEKTGADGAAVALAEGNLLVCRASLGEIATDIGVALSVNTGITGACVRSAKLLHCRDAELDARVDAAVCRNLGIRSILVTPILVDEVVVGIVEALSTHPNAFQPAHVKWLEAVADWLRDICYGSNHNASGSSANPPRVKAQHAGITSRELQQPGKQAVSEALMSRISTKRKQQDPGLASFQGTLEKIAVASTWEDVRHELLQRLEA
jgi:putative methionine-R-sulfoxide reductase with GAF domain